MLSFAEIQETLPILSFIPAELLFAFLALLAIWTTAIKGFALWHAARNQQSVWFVALLVVNTIGILELVYLLAFRKDTQPGAVVAPSAPTA